MKKIKIAKLLNQLDGHYGTLVHRFLDYETPWQLLCATILSAQCTDARVNLVTPFLFGHYKSLNELANANLSELEDVIRTTGFYRTKAKNIIASCRIIRDIYGGEVPKNIEELTALPGVGRKTANVIRCHIFCEPGITVDTHVKRVSRRLGLTKESDPVKIEFALMKILPKENWIRYNFQIITHGRTICKAPTPRCEECFLQEVCDYYQQLLTR
ncbi:MAG: endonuclease III [Lachnospiraceae bacterium]|nr:endonuclease III [Lachnospiraceae bacterium]